LLSLKRYQTEGLNVVDCSAGLYRLTTLLPSGAPWFTSQLFCCDTAAYSRVVSLIVVYVLHCDGCWPAATAQQLARTSTHSACETGTRSRRRQLAPFREEKVTSPWDLPPRERSLRPAGHWPPRVCRQCTQHAPDAATRGRHAAAGELVKASAGPNRGWSQHTLAGAAPAVRARDGMARPVSCCCLGLAGEEVTATAEGCVVVPFSLPSRPESTSIHISTDSTGPLISANSPLVHSPFLTVPSDADFKAAPTSLAARGVVVVAVHYNGT